ncbi:MAG: hypothetical protein ACK5LF_17090 [Bacteroides xylanisolvens]
MREYFTDPVYLPWHRMANIDYWLGMVLPSWEPDYLARVAKNIYETIK